MPQMMPINWILSFFMFIMIFILFNILNYYIFKLKINNMKTNKKTNTNTKIFFSFKKFFWML